MSEKKQAEAANGWPELPPRYELKRELKRGGMGAVFEAFDTVLKSHVALKVNLRTEPAMRAAFEREAQLLATLRHAALPRCLDLQTAGDVQFLVMDFIEGDDLSALMAKRPEGSRPLPAETVLDWALQLLDVLDYLHGLNILHRDLKTANIKVKDGQVFLLDLGLAYGQTEEMSTLSRGEYNWGCHSPGYSPPEQFRREQAQPASDLYSLAATLYKLLTAYTPPEADDRVLRVERGEADPLKDIRFYNPGLDVHVSLEINRALLLDVRRRPQSAREMARMMFPEPPEPAPVPAPPPVAARPCAWRRPLRLLEALLLIVLPLGALIYTVSGAGAFRSARTSPGPAEAVRELSPAQQAVELTAAADHQRLIGQHKDALALIGESLALNPNDPYAWFVRLSLWCDTDEAAESGTHPPEVLEEARRIVRALPSPGTREEYLALAQAHLALSNLDQAYAFAEKAAGPERDFGPALLISVSAGFKKEIRMAGKKVKDALAVADRRLADCDAAIEDMPDYPQAYLIRADIHTSMLSPVRARRDLMRALEIAPRPFFHVMLGDVYMILADYDDAARKNYLDTAREHYYKALAENQKLRRAFHGLAVLDENAGDWRGAIQHYLKANGVRQTADTFKRLGRAYGQLGRPHLLDAKVNYEQALRLAPNDREALTALSELETEMEAPEEAEQPIP